MNWNWSIWTDNRFTNSWTLEFEGSRIECIRYLEVVTEYTNRMWNFVMVNPNNRAAYDAGITWRTT